MAQKLPKNFAEYLQNSHSDVVLNIRHEGGEYTEEKRLGIERILDAVTLICHQLTVERIPTTNSTLVKLRFASKKLYVQMDEAARMIKIRLVSPMRTYDSALLIFRASYEGHIFVENEDLWLLGLEALYSIAKTVERGIISRQVADDLVGNPGLTV